MEFSYSGVIKKMDTLGRILLPKKMGKRMGKDIDITVDDDIILLKPSEKVPGVRFTRKVDTLNRVVIPSEIRERLNIQPDDKLELLLYKNDDIIGLRIYHDKCCICGLDETLDRELFNVRGKRMCGVCIEHIKADF